MENQHIFVERHEWSNPEPVSSTIVNTIAAIDGSRPTEVDPLHAAVDPDALDSLLQPRLDGTARRGGKVSFPVGEYHVTLHCDGTILVRAPEDT